jgi:hypothetical protein
VRIKKKNVARLASLSALGAGALGVAAGTAQASDIIFIPLPPGIVVGFSSSVLSGASFPVLSNIFAVRTASRKKSGWTTLGVIAFGFGYSNPFFFKRRASFLSIVGPGIKWSNAPGSTGSGPFAIATRGYKGTTGVKFGGAGSNNGNFSDQYALFQFQAGGNTLYGWLELSSSVSAFSGPDVTLEGLAVDISGAQILSGDTGTPEPSTMALTGLAALALGAAGLRRWRAARKRAA